MMVAGTSLVETPNTCSGSDRCSLPVGGAEIQQYPADSRERLTSGVAPQIETIRPVDIESPG